MQPTNDYSVIARRPPDLDDFVDMARRHWAWIAGPLFAGLVLSVVVAFLWPDTYVSDSRLRIVPAQVPERFVPSNFSTQMEQRVQVIMQGALSRENLASLIKKHNLYPDLIASKPMEDVVEQMRKRFSLRVDGARNTPWETGPSAVFQITFGYSNRTSARAVVQDVVGQLMSENVTVTKAQSDMTASFLDAEYQTAAKNMRDLDTQMTEARIRFAGSLPDDMSVTVGALSSLQTQLSSVSDAISRARQDKFLLVTHIENLRSQQKNLGSVQEDAATTIKGERLTQLNRSILEMETQISALRETYKEDHPDIRTSKARLEVLRRERDRLEEEDRQAQASSKPRPQSAGALKTSKDIDLAIHSAQAQIQLKDEEIEQRLKAQAKINEQIQLYQSRIQNSPTGAVEYARINRDYQMAKEKYQEISQKKSQSDMAKKVVDRQAGERLELLEQASLPLSPKEPNRWLIIGTGLAIGLIAGAGMVAGIEMKDTSLKNLKDVRAYTRLNVLGSVPLLENDLVTRRKRRLAWLAWSAATIVGVVMMSSSMLYYFAINR